MPQGGNTILGRWYEPSGSPTDTLAVIRDKLIFTKAADDARLLVITDIQGLSDTTRQAIAGSQDLADFDAGLEAEEWEIRDRLDYYSYPTRTENLTVADGAWFSPDSVDSFCGEHATNVASNTVDGNTGTFWQHFNSHTHNITFKLRDWPKKVTKIRFFYGSALPVRERLSNMTVKASRDISQIDVAANTLETGINITWPGTGGVWVEHTLANFKSNARYIKLEFDTADASNNAQMREFEVWVETRQVGDLFS